MQDAITIPPCCPQINSTSKRTGIEVVRYNFSDPQAGKDLCGRQIAPCKQCLRNYLAENNDIQTAQDVKNALVSSPQHHRNLSSSVHSRSFSDVANVASNKIPNITKCDNFSFERDSITVWQAYGIGAGQKIPYSSFMYTQDTSGLKRVSEWSQESIITTQRREAGLELKILLSWLPRSHVWNQGASKRLAPCKRLMIIWTPGVMS